MIRRRLSPSLRGVYALIFLAAPTLVLADALLARSCASASAVQPVPPGGSRDAVLNLRRASITGGGLSAGVPGSIPVDPGPRPGSPGAGAPELGRDGDAADRAATVACIPALTPPMLGMCKQALLRFEEVDSVSGTIPGEEGAGLGPTFNGNSCAMCHAQPAVLGSSPSLFSPQDPGPNPQVLLATRDGARNTVPPFIAADGPIRVVRFRSDNDSHALFTSAGRSDARGCTQAQPDFAAELGTNNLAFRIPLALFGLGFVETLSESTLRSNLA